MTTHQPSVPPAPKVGDQAPESDQMYFPNTKPVLLVFLRHCGCPCMNLFYVPFVGDEKWWSLSMLCEG